MAKKASKAYRERLSKDLPHMSVEFDEGAGRYAFYETSKDGVKTLDSLSGGQEPTDRDIERLRSKNRHRLGIETVADMRAAMRKMNDHNAKLKEKEDDRARDSVRKVLRPMLRHAFRHGRVYAMPGSQHAPEKVGAPQVIYRSKR